MRLTCLSAFAACLSLLVGCGPAGPKLHPVSGTVTIGGKPAPGISVTFNPEKGVSSAGRTDESGKYTLSTATGETGAVVGKHKVVLADGGTVASSGTFDPQKMMAEREGQMGNANRGNSPQPKAEKLSFPKEYADPASTPASYEVKEGSNTYDIVVP